jgi:sulfite reductase alpha subunit-like flavoprotein
MERERTEERRDARYMAKDVHNCLVGILSKHGNMSQEDAEAYTQNMQSGGRYLSDTWF